MKRSIALLLVLLVSSLLLLGAVPIAQAKCGENITVRTDDGATIGMKHYRPDGHAPFNDGGQPVIFVPGASANFNEFDVRTPPGERYSVNLPDDLPEWALEDPYIEDDPMKFYSMAYYLYDMGYDVWLANYRGQGRWPNRSWGRPDTNIDDYAIYDVKAVVREVRARTGLKPVYIGHSMGCTMAYAYLEGAVFQPGWNPHVVSDPGKVSERNGGDGQEALKGLISLDGPVIPTDRISVPNFAWLFLTPPMYLNFRPITRLIGEPVAGPFLLLEHILWAIRECIPDPIDDYLTFLFFVKPDNMEVGVLQYMAEYALDGVYMHAMAQFTDAMGCGKFREYYRNGFLGRLRLVPPEPRPGDGYYCYSDNLDKISLPALILADSTVDLTDPADIERTYNLKTRNPLDEFQVMADTAHVDFVNGLSAPYETFPVIGDWLENLCAH